VATQGNFGGASPRKEVKRLSTNGRVIISLGGHETGPAVGQISTRKRDKRPGKGKVTLGSVVATTSRANRPIRMVVEYPGIRVVSQRSVPVGIACALEHRLARRKKVAVSQLSGEFFVADPGDVASYDSVSRFFADEGVDYQVPFSAADVPSMLELVASGLAIALLPKTAAESWPGVCYVPLEGYSPSCNAGIITGDRAIGVTTQALLKVLNNTGRFETAH
jgi:LysR substrate binding domain